ncbi:MAG: glycosyltransferase family 4 protein [Saprospiraceae bacterium]|nr:glycosyltransferase family 4 protein [Saprospiraceae bacterium]
MTRNKKTVAILNFAPVYRKTIYLLMEDKLGCDFYFGDKTLADVKKLDYSLFSNKVNELKFVRLFKNFNWLSGSISLSFKPYTNYIMTGEPYCISSWFVLILNRILGKKSIVWTHGWYGNEGKVKAWVKRLYFGLTDIILLYGEYAKKKMMEVGFDDKKLHVIYNSLDYEMHTELFGESLKEDIYQRHFGNMLPVVLFIGRLVRTKKLELLIKSQKISASKGQPFNVVIIGGGEDEQRLKELSKTDDAYFWYVGPLYDEATIGKFLFNADLCVSPGNVGLTAIHALTFGLPVITHNNFLAQMPEFEAITPGKTGMFFKENDEEDLYNKIVEFLENQSNKDETRTQCRKIIAEHYNPHEQVKIFKKLCIENPAN